jgi:hypothetical protein
VATLAAPVLVPVVSPVRLRVPTIRIRKAGEKTIVTSLEIVSPVNKYGAAFERFRQKWVRLHAAGVNLVEVDLIRRGRRITDFQELREAPYLVTVTRASSRQTGAWPISIREQLPKFPVPLLEPDPDGVVDLQAIMNGIYDIARYANDIDYAADPPPPRLSAEDVAWARERALLANR